MGLQKTLDARSIYPLKRAAVIVKVFTHGERHTDEKLRWNYVLVACKLNPGTASVAVFDQDDNFKGWWYR
jgi:hypothetical protein